MGRKAFFTRDEVFKAADELAAQGEDVAVRTLHAYLGGGSFSSIMKYLTIWKDQRPPEEASGRADMPASMTNAFDAVWKTAMAQASKELTGEREKAAQAVQDADMRAAETLSAIEELENTNNEQAEKLEELTGKLDSTEGKLHSAMSEKSALAAVNSQLKEQAQKLQSSFEGLQSVHEQQQKKHAEELTAQAKQQADEVNKLKVELAKLEAARDSAKEEASKNQERVIVATEEAKAALAKLEARLESIGKEKDVAIKEAAELKGRTETMKSQNEQLLSRLTEKEEKKGT